MPYKPDTGELQLLVPGHLVLGAVLGKQGAEVGPQLVALADVAALVFGVGQRPMAEGHLGQALGQAQERGDSRMDEYHGLESNLALERQQ